jgi:peptidoglycan/xylan/chitin deacetylase (PgdA/CDA1 family)
VTVIRSLKLGWAAATMCIALLAGWRGAHAGEPLAIPVLVYHRFAATAQDAMTVRTQTFEDQLRMLREHGYQVIALRDVVNRVNEPDRQTAWPSKPIAITVDDGHRSVYGVFAPIVLRERIPVTLFIYPSAISNASYAMTWQQLRALRATGLFDVQSHTYWHPNFNVERRRRTAPDFVRFVRDQLDRSRARLDAELGTHVDMLAWPFGIYDDELISIAAGEGYVAGFTLDARRITAASRPLALPRFLITDACDARALARLLGEPADRAMPPTLTSRQAPRASTGARQP